MTAVRDARQPNFRSHLAVMRALACALVGALVVAAVPAPAAADGSSMEAYLRELVAKQRRAAIERELDALDAAAGQSSDPEQALIDEIEAERTRYADNIQQAAASAMTPLALVASVFAIESAADVFLALFPVGKAAGLVQDLRKARKARKAYKTIEKDVAAALDHRQLRFVRAARHLSGSDLGALVGISKRVQNPEVVTELMTRAAKGEADLAWIEKKLKKGTFDGAFVEHFTRFDANPTWRQLQGVLDNRISGEARDSFMSKMVGFLGEEGAARWAAGPDFMRRRGLRKGVAMQRGHKSLDLVIHDKTNKVLVFAEVKSWGEIWNVPLMTNRLLDQLKAHDGKIGDIVRASSKDGPHKVEKLLMVNGSGYSWFKEENRNNFLEKMKQETPGWQVEIIPDGVIEDAGHFIDRMRKGD